MTAQWIEETGNIGGKPARIRVDGAARTSPDASRPELLTVRVPLAKADANGLSTNEEDEDLDDLRSVLSKVLEIRLHARLVGSVVSGGTFELSYYAASGEGLDTAVQEALVDFEEYTATSSHRADPNWEHVRTALKG